MTSRRQIRHHEPLSRSRLAPPAGRSGAFVTTLWARSQLLLPASTKLDDVVVGLDLADAPYRCRHRDPVSPAPVR
jgi:hypothetical protein